MKTSIRVWFGAVICAAVLFIATFNFLPILVHAETEAEKAIQKAEAETAKAEADAKTAGEAQKAADDAAKKAGTGPTPQDAAADAAAKEADQAAEAADKAQDEAQKQQLEAEDAAKAAKEAGGSNEEKNKKAADEKKEAEDAAKAANTAEDEAAAKEKAADAADKAAKGADNKDTKNGDLNKKKEDARKARKQRRAQRRRAAQAIRDARRLLHEATRTGRGSETESRKKRLDALEERLKALVKIEEDARNGPPPKPGKDGPPKKDDSDGAPKNYVPPGAEPTPESKSANGLKSVTFALPQGRVTVNLPDDMMAGDTISGTVIAEPKGDTKEDRAQNLGVLTGLVVEIDNKRVEPFSGTPEKEREGVIQQTFWIYTSDAPKVQPVSIGDTNPRSVQVALLNTDNKKVGQITINNWWMPYEEPVRVDPKMTQPTDPPGTVVTPRPNEPVRVDPKTSQPTDPPGTIVTPGPQTDPPKKIVTIVGETFGSKPMDLDYSGFDIPRLGQQGRPIVVTGPFDGNSSNTTVNSTVASNSSVIEGPAGSSPRRLVVIAESPRRAIFQSPPDVAGTMEVTVKDGERQATGRFRNIGVQLTAPKTSLLKGESTELKVQVTGLEGLKEPVPLTLESQGVITMTGGNYQPLTIRPSEVRADGSYSTTRGITGLQAGGWAATATVVTGPFDACLQDDSRPGIVIRWNTFTGDYSFRPPSPPSPLGDPSPTPTGGATTIGKGTMQMKGCIITLSHNAPDRRVFASLDACTNKGNASVEMPASNTKFTITDSNTKDNTAASGP